MPRKLILKLKKPSKIISLFDNGNLLDPFLLKLDFHQYSSASSQFITLTTRYINNFSCPTYRHIKMSLLSNAAIANNTKRKLSCILLRNRTFREKIVHNKSIAFLHLILLYCCQCDLLWNRHYTNFGWNLDKLSNKLTQQTITTQLSTSQLNLYPISFFIYRVSLELLK